MIPRSDVCICLTVEAYDLLLELAEKDTKKILKDASFLLHENERCVLLYWTNYIWTGDRYGVICLECILDNDLSVFDYYYLHMDSTATAASGSGLYIDNPFHVALYRELIFSHKDSLEK